MFPTGSNCEQRPSVRRHRTLSQWSQMPQTSVAVGITVRPVRAHRVGPRRAAEASTFRCGAPEIGIGQVGTLQIGALQGSANKVGPGQVGAVEIGTLQVLSL